LRNSDSGGDVLAASKAVVSCCVCVSGSGSFGMCPAGASTVSLSDTGSSAFGSYSKHQPSLSLPSEQSERLFIRLCVCLSVCNVHGVNRSISLNANSSEMVKTTDFKFDKHVSRVSPNMIPLNLWKRGMARVM